MDASKYPKRLCKQDITFSISGQGIRVHFKQFGNQNLRWIVLAGISHRNIQSANAWRQRIQKRYQKVFFSKNHGNFVQCCIGIFIDNFSMMLPVILAWPIVFGVPITWIFLDCEKSSTIHSKGWICSVPVFFEASYKQSCIMKWII